MAMAEMEEERKAEMEITEEETEITEAEMEITDTKEKLPEQMGAMLKGVIKPLSKTKSPKETFLGNNMIFSISQKIIYAHKRLCYICICHLLGPPAKTIPPTVWPL